MRAPGLCERRAVFDVDGTGSYGGGGDYGGNSYDSGGGGSSDNSSASTAAAADPGGTFGPDGGAEGGSNWGTSGFESGANDGSTLDTIDGLDKGDTRSILDKVADLLFGTPTENRVANAYLSALSVAVPGMGLAMELADRARAAGWDVQDDFAGGEGPTGGGPYGGYTGTRGATFAGGPYAQSALQPSNAAPDPLLGFLSTAPASRGPYMADLDALDAAAAPGGALPGSSGTSAPAAPAGGLPVGLLTVAAIVAGVAFG